MGAGSYYLFYAVAVQHFYVRHGLHLEQEFISCTFCRIAITAFFRSQNGEINLCFMEKLYKGLGNFLGSIVKTPGASHKKKNFRHFALGGVFGHCWDFYWFTHFSGFRFLVSGFWFLVSGIRMKSQFSSFQFKRSIWL